MFLEAGLEEITIQDKPGLYFAQGVRTSACDSC
jgi:hypothetical protein